jgi:hypothetical protein
MSLRPERNRFDPALQELQVTLDACVRGAGREKSPLGVVPG